MNRAGRRLLQLRLDEVLDDRTPGHQRVLKARRGTVYHTYSTYARGLDMLNGAYHYLDLVPKGRDED